MSKNYDYDYIIIGSGPAGRTVATKLASSNKKIAIIDYQNFGGAEINTRDLPYKISLDFAHNYHKFTHSPAVSRSASHFNYPTFITDKDQIISEVRAKLIEDCQAQGIQIITGFANFIDSHTIAVDSHQYTAKYFILATGSELKATEITGLETVNYLTPDTTLSANRLPKFVFVVGGGSTGVEIAEFYAKLGIGVIIMERSTQLLPREDEEASKTITEYFEKELGITVVTGSRVTAITEDYTSKIVVFTSGAGEKMVRVDKVVLATGSTPFLNYGLENAGINYKKTGIIVDKYFNTSTKNIFAIGDCIESPDSSTERSTIQGSVLANNFLHRQKITASYSGIIRHIDTCPAVAVTGLNERDILARDLKCKRAVVYFKDVLSINSPEYQYGFVKLITDHSGHLLGATIVSPEAKSMISELSLVYANRLSVESIAITPHATDNPAAAIALAAKKLLSK